MYLALAPGSPPASAHPRARTRYAVAAASAETPRPPWTCTRHRRGLGRLLGHEHERRRRQLRALVGLVVEEPRRAARQVAAALHGDRDVGQRMRDALQRRDRHAQRVAGLGELRGDRHRLLDEADQRRRGQHPPFIQRPLVFRQRVGAAGQHGPAVGGGGIDPRHRQPADVVDLRRAGAERQPHDVVAVAHDDVVGDRSGRDQPDAGHVVVLRVERGQLLAVDDVGLQRAQAGRAAEPRRRGRSTAPAPATGRSPRPPASGRPASPRRRRRIRAAPSSSRPWRTTAPTGSCRTRTPRRPAPSRSGSAS